MATFKERQINALIGYLARSKQGNTIKEETAPYSLELPDDLGLSNF